MTQNDTEKTPLTPLWRRLEVLRLMRGYSMRELARRAGLSHSTISLDEKGYHRPTDRTLGKLAAALQVPKEYLLSYTKAEKLTRHDWQARYAALEEARRRKGEQPPLELNGESREPDNG